MDWPFIENRNNFIVDYHTSMRSCAEAHVAVPLLGITKIKTKLRSVVVSFMDISFGLGIKQAGFALLVDHIDSPRREQIDLAQKG